MLKIPIVNRYMCFPSQLHNYIKIIKNKNMYPLIDYCNENKHDHLSNYKKIKKIINEYPNNKIAVKLSSLNIENDYGGCSDYLNKLCIEAKKIILK